MTGAFRIQNLYPLFQRILKQRGLHFLVAPYTACAQLAYFDMIDSDQIGGVMGSQELLLYPIKDSVIRTIDWDNKSIQAISKKKVIRSLTPTGSESRFIDCFLMTGTSFLPPFPALLETSLYTTHNISNAANLLRTSENSVATACASFNDILQRLGDPNWLDKYHKARMVVNHFIYIAENGEIRVNEYDTLTKDNHEYLGLQLPAELFHYLNTGLIGSRLLSYITHGQILVQPTLDGVISDEYKHLVTKQIVPIKEQALSLLIPRLHRGIQHKNITMRVWFDKNFSYTINRSLQPPPSQQVATWNVKQEDLQECFPADFAGPVSLEVLALANDDFVKKTFPQGRPIRGIDSTEMITSVAIWRFLHLRGYVDDEHKLTKWGNALATTLLALQDANENRPEVTGLDEAALLAFELLRFGLLNGKYVKNLPGLPRKGSDTDKASVVLISQCASLLKLRHQALGYTGPLNKSLLTFRSFSTTIREADRDLIEAIVASMFMYGQSKRDRDDQLEISQR